MIAVAVVFLPMDWIEYQFEGAWDLRNRWLWCWFVAGAGVLVVNSSFQKERNPSTRAFLSSLPVTLADLFLSKIIENLLYTFLCTTIVATGFWIFAYPVELRYLLLGVPVSIFCNTVYVSIYYLADFDKAQTFLLPAMIIPMLIGGWMKIDLDTKAFFVDPMISVSASIVMVVLSAVIILYMCKKKRRAS